MGIKMKFKTAILGKLRDQRGAVLVIVAILFTFVFIGLLAFAIDIGHLVVVKNELQNAADAGALAGAADLYYDNAGTMEVDPAANQTAYDTATQNKSDQVTVEVHNPASNEHDVQRGHWNPETRTFTPSKSLDVVSLLGVDTSDLNQMDGTYEYPLGSGEKPVLINAVKVTTWRGNASVQNASPVTSFFARIFGIDSFISSADAVAWLGYKSKILPDTIDLPLALCMESVQTDGEYDCNIGRRINSGLPQGDDSTYNTGGWTDFNQLEGDTDECPGRASTSTVNQIYACGETANDLDIELPKKMSTNGGEIAAVYNAVLKCWHDDYEANGTVSPWSVVLPVVICEGKNVGVCPMAVTALRVNIVFVSSGGTPNPDTDPPKAYADDVVEWAYTEPFCDVYNNRIGTKNIAEALGILKTQETIYKNMPDSVIADRWAGQSDYSAGIARWDCFTDKLNLVNVDGNAAPLDKKSIYFRPECSVPTDEMDGVGSFNTGAYSDHPVLVE